MSKEDEKAIAAEEAKLRLQQAKLAYVDAYKQTLELRSEFSKQPGYVRQKTGEELALQQAKKAFGEFTPDNHKAMERNTNDGKGYDIKLDSGEKRHIPNQLALYKEVVNFNKENGGFYDEKYIGETAPEDLKRLKAANSRLQATKDAFVNLHDGEEKHQAYSTLRDFEKQTKTDYKKAENKTPEVSESLYRSEDVEIEQKASDEKVLDSLDENVARKADQDKSHSKEPDKATQQDKFGAFIKVGKLASDVYYWKSQTDIEAFRDRGSRISTKSSSDRVVKSIVDLAEAKNWKELTITKGTPEFKRGVWMEASLRGLDVHGYKPSPQDRLLLEEKLKEAGKDTESKEQSKGENNQVIDSGKAEKNTTEKQSEHPATPAKNIGSDNIDYVYPGSTKGLGSSEISQDVNQASIKRAAAQAKVAAEVVDDLRSEGVNGIAEGGQKLSADEKLKNIAEKVNLESNQAYENLEPSVDKAISFKENNQNLDVSNEAIENSASSHIKDFSAKGNILTYQLHGQDTTNHITLHDSSENKAAENAVSDLGESLKPGTSVDELLGELDKLAEKSNGKYSVIDHTTGLSSVESQKHLGAVNDASFDKNAEEVPGYHSGDKQYLDKGQMAYRKDLTNAYTGMDKELAVKQHPELESVYKLRYAANEFAQKELKNGNDQAKFVSAVVNKAIERLAAGEKISVPNVQQSNQLQAQAQQQREAQQAQGVGR